MLTWFAPLLTIAIKTCLSCTVIQNKKAACKAAVKVRYCIKNVQAALFRFQTRCLARLSVGFVGFADIEFLRHQTHAHHHHGQ